MTPVPQGSSRRQIAALFRQPDEARRWMRGINGPHGLEVPHPGELVFRHHGTALDHVAIGVLEYSTSVNIRIDDLTHSYSISLPLAGVQHIEHQQDSFASDTTTGAIISPHQPLHLYMAEDCRKQQVRLSRQAVDHKLTQLLRRRLTAPVVFDPRIPLDGTMGEWWKMIAHLQELLNAESSLCDLPEVWGNFENSLITSLLYSQPHNYSDELLDRHRDKPAYLDRLETLMHESLDRSLTLDSLELAAGVSRERLYQDFHAHFGATPIAHFRNLRFAQARRRLEQAGPRENVSSIAMDCGFLQLGRFSKEYQTRFGEQPSQAIHRHTRVSSS